MSEPALLYEKREGIAYLTFNRSAVRNAMSPEVMCRLADAWQDYMVLATEDAKEGPRAFMEKRQPRYVGR